MGGAMSVSQRALVLGATGHIGQAVVREFLSQGYRVTAATRREHSPSLAGLDVEIARGNTDSPGQFDAWVCGHDVVIDAAAPYPLNLFPTEGRAEQDPYEHARQRTQALVDAVATHNAQLGFISSFTTLPRQEKGLALIEARWRRRIHPYFAIKRLMESMILDAARGGLRAVIVNPTTCLGPWDEKRRELCFIPQLLAGEVLATARKEINVIDVRDVAAGVRAAIDAECYGKPLLLGGHDLRVDTLARRVCALGEVSPPLLRVSARLSAASLYWTEAACAMGGKPPPVPSLSLLLLCDGSPLGPATELRQLGLRARPLDETLSDAVEWYRRLGYC